VKLKRLLSLLLILCMIVTLAACGSKASRDDEDDEDEETVSSSKDKGSLFSKGSDDDKGKDKAKNKDKDEDEDTDILWGKGDDIDDEDNDDSDIEDWSDPGDNVVIEDWSDPGDNDDNSDSYEDYTDPADLEGVDLPDDFPSHLIPMYKDGTVYYVFSENIDDVTVYYVVQNCNDSAKDVVDYYERKLEDSDDFKSEGGMGYYSVQGETGGYTFTIFIADDAANKGHCIVSIEVREE
jgi:hypothetical protein